MPESTADSLTMFISCAQAFLQTEAQLTMTDEQAKYMIVHHFDAFSSAYMRYKQNPDEIAQQMLRRVVDAAIALHRHKSEVQVIAKK